MFLRYFGKITVFTFMTVALLASSAHAQMPSPQEPGNEVGYFCNMTIVHHSAAKAQLFLKRKQDKPLWFSTIRDLFVYTHSPEEDQRIAGAYVNDMGVADWNAPEEGTWIDAYEAHYVINTERRNGMGGPAIVPFSSVEKAEEFIAQHGGEIKSFNDVPESYIFDVQGSDAMGDSEAMDHMDHGSSHN